MKFNLEKVGETVNAREYITSIEIAQLTGKNTGMSCVTLDLC